MMTTYDIRFWCQDCGKVIGTLHDITIPQVQSIMAVMIQHEREAHVPRYIEGCLTNPSR